VLLGLLLDFFNNFLMRHLIPHPPLKIFTRYDSTTLVNIVSQSKAAVYIRHKDYGVQILYYILYVSRRTEVVSIQSLNNYVQLKSSNTFREVNLCHHIYINMKSKRYLLWNRYLCNKYFYYLGWDARICGLSI